MFKKSAIAAICCVALVGCETIDNNPRTSAGAVGGALAGAALGTLVGGDDRRNALVGAGIGLLAGAAVGQYLDRQQRALEQDLAGTGAEVERIGETIRVNFPAGLTFATDSAKIQQGFRPPLRNVGNTLNQFPQSYLDVVGHTDSTGSEQYNQRLSERRANSVANFLSRTGVDRRRMATFGQGESQPVASNADEFGRQQNRRVELRIIPATDS
ncbi:MAG: OmpA family protein [Pseudomonadota bacterium]